MRKNLTQICFPKQWKTISEKEMTDTGFPVFGANGIIGYYTEYNHSERTLIIGCRGTCGSVINTEDNSYINGNAMALDNLSKDIYIKWLFYYLKNRGFRDVITGSSQPQIIRKSLEKVEVDYPNLEEQHLIADKLDEIYRIINLKKEQLIKLDLLIKSRFIGSWELAA